MIDERWTNIKRDDKSGVIQLLRDKGFTVISVK